MTRLRALLALTLSAGLLAALPPAPASADGAVVPVITVLPEEGGHPEIVRAVVSSDSDVASVTLSVPLTRVTRDFVLHRDGATDVWTSDPLELGWGVYESTLTAVDGEGDLATADVLVDFRIVPRLEEHTFRASGLSFAEPGVVATGRIAAWNPQSRKDVVPAGFVQLWFAGPDGDVTSGGRAAVDGVTGAYTVTGRPATFASGDSFDVRVEWTDDLFHVRDALLGFPAAEANVIDAATVTATTVPSRITMDSPTLLTGPSVPALVSGVVQQQVAGVWKPVPGVRLAVDVAGGRRFVTAGSDGRFSTSVTVAATTTVTVRLDDPRGVYLRAAETPAQVVTVKVPLRTTLTLVTRDLNAAWKGSVNARLSTLGAGLPGRMRLSLQHSRTGTGGWSTIGSMTTDSSGAVAWSGKVVRPSWYHRIVFAGTSSWQSSKTAAFRWPRHEARVVKARVTPTTLGKGGTITVSGTLTREIDGSYVPFGRGKVVEYFFRAKGSATSVAKGSSRTTSTGTFSKSFRATKDGEWFVVWYTTSTKYVNAYGPRRFVDVR